MVDDEKPASDKGFISGYTGEPKPPAIEPILLWTFVSFCVIGAIFLAFKLLRKVYKWCVAQGAQTDPTTQLDTNQPSSAAQDMGTDQRVLQEASHHHRLLPKQAAAKAATAGTRKALDPIPEQPMDASEESTSLLSMRKDPNDDTNQAAVNNNETDPLSAPDSTPSTAENKSTECSGALTGRPNQSEMEEVAKCESTNTGLVATGQQCVSSDEQPELESTFAEPDSTTDPESQLLHPDEPSKASGDEISEVMTKDDDVALDAQNDSPGAIGDEIGMENMACTSDSETRDCTTSDSTAAASTQQGSHATSSAGTLEGERAQI